MKPPALVGRGEVVEDFQVVLDRLQDGRAAVAPIITGPRGSGKTVLLNELLVQARAKEWFAASEEVNPSMSLSALIALLAHEMLLEMSARRRAEERVRRALGVLKAFTAVSVLGVKVNIEAEAITGTADSGMFDRDLRRLFVELGEAAREQAVGIVFGLDEVHVLGQQELDSLNAALHVTAQKQLPVAFVGAGLFPSWQSGSERPDPTRITSYAARMDAPSYVRLDPLSSEASRHALADPAAAEGVEYVDAALDQAIVFCEGNSWLLQLLGKVAWETADGTRIDEESVSAARKKVQRQLDQWFFPRLLRDCDRDDLELLTTVAEAGTEWVSYADIRDELAQTVNEPVAIIGKLARKDLVSLDYIGNIRHENFRLGFSVPRLRAYLGGPGIS